MEHIKMTDSSIVLKKSTSSQQLIIKNAYLDHRYSIGCMASYFRFELEVLGGGGGEIKI